jgi:16S rRNA C1402 (ribose-2'-O) methylase RsmI
MQYYYGDQMPLRVLDEAEFWKHQEEEHTVVIRELVKDLEQEYVKELKEWEEEFTKTHQRVVRYIETVNRSNGQITQALYQDVLQLISFCLKQSEQFINFCRILVKESIPISKNQTAKVVLNHIIVESEYFIGVAQTILYQS